MTHQSEREPRTAGALIVDQRRILEDLLGPRTVRRALDGLPPDVRQELDEAMPISWLRVSAMEQCYVAIASEARRDPDELHDEVGRLGVRKTFHTFWRLLLRFTSDQALVTRTPLMFAKAFDTGRLEARITGPGAADIRLLDWPEVPKWVVDGTATAIETVLELAGRRDPSVLWERTEDGALLRASWQRW